MNPLDARLVVNWYLWRDRNVLVCAPAKCGSTSVKRLIAPEWFRDDFRVRAAEVGAGPFAPFEVPDLPRVLITRDPVERFASLWRDKCRDAPGSHRVLRLTRGRSPDELMDLIEACPLGDEHWCPQYLYSVPRMRCVRVENVASVLGWQFEQLRTTSPRPDDPPMPVERVRAFYAQDCRLWEGSE